MLNRDQIISTLTQFKSVYRRHLHPDIKKAINLPSIGISRKSLQTMSDQQLLERTQKLINRIDDYQYDRDRLHKGLKDFTDHLKDMMDSKSTSQKDAHNHLVKLIQALQMHDDSESIEDIERHAKAIARSSYGDIQDQAHAALKKFEDKDVLIKKLLRSHFK